MFLQMLQKKKVERTFRFFNYCDIIIMVTVLIFLNNVPYNIKTKTLHILAHTMLCVNTYNISAAID
jgi:hypothetical protein